jgi:Lysozyme like domain/LysM domain
MIAPTYTVEPGNTLSAIAVTEYGNAGDWPIIWQANRGVVANPNLIYPHEKLYIPKHGSNVSVASYSSDGDGDHDNDSTDSPATPYVPQHAGSTVSGTLGCSQLESLWTANGGSSAEAFTAAEIAMAESGGNEYATGPVGERGYWQINPDHGSLSTYDPNGNAKAAIIISADGTNWTPWTTYTSGAYNGRC